MSQYLGHILVETFTPFLLFPILQTPVGLDSESSYGFEGLLCSGKNSYGSFKKSSAVPIAGILVGLAGFGGIAAAIGIAGVLAGESGTDTIYYSYTQTSWREGSVFKVRGVCKFYRNTARTSYITSLTFKRKRVVFYMDNSFKKEYQKLLILFSIINGIYFLSYTNNIFHEIYIISLIIQVIFPLVISIYLIYKYYSKNIRNIKYLTLLFILIILVSFLFFMKFL